MSGPTGRDARRGRAPPACRDSDWSGAQVRDVGSRRRRPSIEWSMNQARRAGFVDQASAQPLDALPVAGGKMLVAFDLKLYSVLSLREGLAERRELPPPPRVPLALARRVAMLPSPSTTTAVAKYKDLYRLILDATTMDWELSTEARALPATGSGA